jgi:arsenate reductase
MYTMYGIPNCGSVKKAKDWLSAQQIAYVFHDYKKSGITSSKLKSWCQQLGWENVINKQGTTWRALDKEVQDSITTATKAIALMMENQSIIKRPIIEKEGIVVAIRFDEQAYEIAFLQQ